MSRVAQDTVPMVIGFCLLMGSIRLAGHAAEPLLERTAAECDRDDNDIVTVEEFLADVADDERDGARWKFHELDVDADGVLTQVECAAVEDEAENEFVAMFRRYDLDKDGVLSRAEYVDPAGEQSAAAAKQEFIDCDADGNAKLSYEEFLFTPRAGLTPKARFARIDANHDEMVDRPEFFRQYAPSSQVAARTAYYGADADGDGELSRQEYLTPPDEQQPHLRSRFAGRDLDDDDRLSHTEYVTPFTGSTWEGTARSEAVQCDVDSDGFLTLFEFAMTPQPAYVRPYLFDLCDQDGDGGLTRDEYVNPYPVEGRAAERITFHNRDANDDQSLSREEYLVPAETLRPRLRSAYATRDADEDGKLSQVEYFTPFVGGQWEAAARSEAVQFDLDQDRFLTLLEYALSPAGDGFPEDLFALLDAGRDGVLDLHEYVTPRPESQRMQVAVDFHHRDRNRDGGLDLDELKMLAAVSAPDPVVELAEQSIQRVLSVWSELDSDRNGTLNPEEWSQGPPRRGLGVVGQFSFAHWDLDADQELTQDEYRTVVNAAYGVCRLDGQSLRRPTGIVVNWAYVTACDLNRDGAVSRAEFIQRFSDDRHAEQRFSELDGDQNGELDNVELIEQHAFALDTFRDFCRIDADLQGKLSHDEIVSCAHPWQRSMCRQLVEAYDANGDGSLDLVEYRLTPFANPVIDWYHGHRDADADGRLAWSEFSAATESRTSSGSSPQFVSIARDVFEHFDVDEDGFLSPREFEFAVDLDQLPAEQAFVALDRDRNGSLGISDASGWERPSRNDPTALLHWEERTMEIEEALAAADSNSDGGLSVDEFQVNRVVVVAALTGHAPLRVSIIATRGEETPSGSATSWNWRFLGLVACNVLFLVGLSWLVLRRA